MKRGTQVQVIDGKRREFLQEGVITMRCRECRADGHDAWYVRFDDGGLGHFLSDQVREVQRCHR